MHDHSESMRAALANTHTGDSLAHTAAECAKIVIRGEQDTNHIAELGIAAVAGQDHVRGPKPSGDG
jgi:hypothetical protein